MTLKRRNSPVGTRSIDVECTQRPWINKWPEEDADMQLRVGLAQKWQREAVGTRSKWGSNSHWGTRSQQRQNNKNRQELHEQWGGGRDRVHLGLGLGLMVESKQVKDKEKVKLHPREGTQTWLKLSNLWISGNQMLKHSLHNARLVTWSWGCGGAEGDNREWWGLWPTLNKEILIPFSKTGPTLHSSSWMNLPFCVPKWALGIRWED